MAREDEIEGILINESANARQIRVKVGDQEVTEWLPKSVITYYRKDPPDRFGRSKVAFTLESWKQRQLGW